MSFNPSPQSFGGSINSIYEIFLKALNISDGDALNHEEDSFNYAENFAAARTLADLWMTNNRLSYQFDPNKMTDFLSRWEEILNIYPTPDQTENERRRIVATKINNYGLSPTQQVITDLLRAVLGDIFIEIKNSDYSEALGSIPGGAVIPGGATLSDGDWRSSIAYMAVLVEQPSTLKDTKYYQKLGQINGVLEDILPAWTSFDWISDDTTLSLAGFYLDHERNLDNNYFDI